MINMDSRMFRLGDITRIEGSAYEGEYLLIIKKPPSRVPSAAPWVRFAEGRFSATSQTLALSCGPEAEPRYLCQLLNAIAANAPHRSRPRVEKLRELEILLPPIAEQRHILTALAGIEQKTALLDNQNRILNEMAQTLFEKYFIYGAGKPRPLGDFIEARSHGQTSEHAPTDTAVGFYNLVLQTRDALQPLFISALIQNSEFLAFARADAAEHLMAFELSDPTVQQIREFNNFARYAEKKLAANDAELRVLEKLRGDMAGQ
jgi:hypothetical protein